MVFCNIQFHLLSISEIIVTILILIDGFLQSKSGRTALVIEASHNPYFNRWFSAMLLVKKCQFSNMSHNPYFNRWFSAI